MGNSEPQEEQILETHLKRLTEIGLALSAERDINKLLDTILAEARCLAWADAGTLYLLDEESQSLRFAILQNDTMQTHVRADSETGGLPPVPLYIDGEPNHSNVSSHAALTGETVNIPDVYEAEDFDFTGPRKYDESTGYKSKSMLVIPMKNYQDRVIGVLQLLNAKDAPNGELLPFSPEIVDIVASLASSASVAITNTQLTQELSDDLDKIKELQNTEKELNQKLSTAFLDLEKTNENLTAALKKVRVIRRFIIAALLLCVLGGGAIFAWNRFFFEEHFTPETTIPSGAEQSSETLTYTVRPMPISSSISLSGSLAPLKEVAVVSPFSGRVAEKFFSYGERVSKGDLLVRMDTTELVVKIRLAKSAFIKARQHHEELKNWASGAEVSRANRAFSKVKTGIESARLKLKETRRLYDKGIISRSEYDSAQEQFENLKYELKSATEELASIMDKGNPGNVEMARLELENARVKLKELEGQLDRASMHAPVAGIVILPQAGMAGTTKIIEKGVEMTQGEILVLLGNLEGFTVKARIDEVDVGKIKFGQNVMASGDAFPNLALTGEVSHVSSQASTDGFSQVPTFDVAVTIESLTPEQKSRLMLGMSCNLQVKVYDNPNALLVPIPMVKTNGTNSWVTMKDQQTGELKEVPVKTGITTVDSVEIISGLKPGDEVVM